MTLNGKNKSYKTYKDLLLNEKYLMWRYAPSKESDEYWSKLINQYPHLEEEIKLADKYLKEKTLPKKYLVTSKKQDLLNKIISTAYSNNESTGKKNKKIRTILRYGVAASILFLSCLLTYNLLLKSNTEHISISQLDTENIQFYSSGKINEFDKNINIKIDKEGTAIISEDKSNKYEIAEVAEQTEIKMDTDELNSITVPYGKRATLTLSDGSKVWLNSGTKLLFPSTFNKNKREVTLIGEMYIEVESNETSPFVVETPEFKVQVLGTKFCISAYEKQEKSVVLVEGKVNLTSKETNVDFPLSPNEYATLNCNNHTFNKRVINVSQHITWTKGYLTLNETPISEVLKYVSRYYNLSLDCSNATNLKTVTCNGKLYLSQDLENVMKSIATLSNTNYKKTNNTIYISDNINSLRNKSTQKK